MEWTYKEIESKRNLMTLTLAYVLILNSTTDIPEFYNRGFKYNIVVRFSFFILCCLLYCLIYRRNNEILSRFFEQKSKKFQLIEDE